MIIRLATEIIIDWLGESSSSITELKGSGPTAYLVSRAFEDKNSAEQRSFCDHDGNLVCPTICKTYVLT
jgi:hypothetical protein